jgi:ribosomal protein S18 acetylase RimI-like enzyme
LGPLLRGDDADNDEPDHPPTHPTDAAAYRALRLAALRAFPHAFRTDYDEALQQPLSWAEKRLATSGDTMFGAFDGAQFDAPLVGAICLRTQDGRKNRHAAELAVDPERQRQGIGRALIAHLLAHARAQGFIRQIALTVTDGNTRAQQLYDASDSGLSASSRTPSCTTVATTPSSTGN